MTKKSAPEQTTKPHDPQPGWPIPPAMKAAAEKHFAARMKAVNAAAEARASASPNPEASPPPQHVTQTLQNGALTAKYHGHLTGATLLASRAENAKIFEDLWKNRFARRAAAGDSTSAESSARTPKAPEKK